MINNIKGEAPLTPQWFFEELVAVMTMDGCAQDTTPVLKCDVLTCGHFVEERKAGHVGRTTAGDCAEFCA